MQRSSPRRARGISCGVILHDADLHAYFLGPEVGSTICYLNELLTDLLKPDAAANAVSFMAEKQRMNLGDGWHEKARTAFSVCPHNLAERFFESLVIYRSFGNVGLPELLPLAVLLLDTDLESYFAPRRNEKKPYRDHLSHQTRVAALAHLLMSGDLPLDAWSSWIGANGLDRWHQTREYHLLLEHLIRLDLAGGFPSSEREPDEAGMVPEPDPVNPFRPHTRLHQCILAAGLLAGLVHDIGYGLKTLACQTDGTSQALERFGIFPPGPEPYADPPQSPVSTLYQLFWERTGPGDRYATMREYVRDHPDSPHSLAGAMWLAYLPERMRREGIYRAIGPDTVRSWGALELICQLGAMMALVHDFPLESEKKKGAQGFRLPTGSGSTSTGLCEDFPFCAVFAASYILHEFGRPYIYTSPTAVRVHAPVLGIELIHPDEWNDPSRPADARRCLARGLL